MMLGIPKKSQATLATECKGRIQSFYLHFGILSSPKTRAGSKETRVRKVRCKLQMRSIEVACVIQVVGMICIARVELQLRNSRA
jgi:hypothetical protein